MRRKALFVPAFAVAAAGALMASGAFGQSQLASSNSGSQSGSSQGTAATATNTQQPRDAGSDHAARHDQDKGEHLDLTCWDKDTGSATTPTIACIWHPATRKDFGGYQLMRRQDTTTPGAAPAAPTMVLTSTTRSTDSFMDTSVSFNTKYTYQLQVLDSTGKVVVKSEPQTVTDEKTEANPDHRADERQMDEHQADVRQRIDQRRDHEERIDDRSGDAAQ